MCIGDRTGSASPRQGVDSRPARATPQSQAVLNMPAGTARESTVSTDPVRSGSPEFRVELIIGGRGPIAGPGDGSWAASERPASGANSSSPKALAISPSEALTAGPTTGSTSGSSSAAQASSQALAPTVPLLR